MNIETIQTSSQAAQWRSQAGAGNPAGELFTTAFAEADIAGATDIMATNCLLCTGSSQIPCGA